MNIGKINRIDIVNNAYVSPLKTIPSPPLELYYRSDLPADRRPTVAIIGSRKPTTYGREVTQHFAAELARRGVIILSGLALGIDGIAHRAALNAGGTTIAVLAGGLHKIYPASHEQLGLRILKSGGAILSEKEAGYEVRPYDFLARNRIVSGLADAVLITEATERSGTSHTVKHAQEQGREVFAVPGPITSPLSAGANAILKQGAHVATRPSDILERLYPQLAAVGLAKTPQQAPLPLGDTPTESRLIALLSEGVSEGHRLAKLCGGTLPEYLEALTMLEIKGDVRAMGGDRWALALR